jgi:hypothetical protein
MLAARVVGVGEQVGEYDSDGTIVSIPAVPFVLVDVKFVYVAPVHQVVVTALPEATQRAATDGWKLPLVLELLNHVVKVSTGACVRLNGPKRA